MVALFGGKEKSGSGASSTERIPRHSSGWGKILARMQAEQSLRVLDIGPTSSKNINFITALGHSIYLANLVEDAAKSEWLVPEQNGTPPHFDVEHFLSAQLNFAGRGFDIVLFWDTADYLPTELLPAVVHRLHQVMAPGGQMLAMFHSATGHTVGGPTVHADFSRYHLTDRNEIEVQRVGLYPIVNTYTNRQVEKLFEEFSGFNFFLSKDNLREVVISR